MIPAGWRRCLSLPVCVESFCDASSRDVEAWLCVSISQSREGRHSLHLPPAELLQRIGTPLQQWRGDQVPQRSANMDTCVRGDDCKQERQRNAEMMWSSGLATLAAAGRLSGRRGCWTGPRSWRTRWPWSKTPAAHWTFWILSEMKTC